MLQDITLCLSGGGFRATYFHLGVIKLLRDYQILRQVKRIYAVSGGSILAADLALNWQEYARPADEAGFYRAALRLVEFGRMDLRGRIVRRAITLGALAPRFRRIRQLELHYADLYSGARLENMDQGGPEVFFLATSLDTGRLCSFSRDGFHDGTRFFPCPDVPLALAVAASSAFPPLFPPVALTRERVHAKAQEFPFDVIHLTDGGVFDNLGCSTIVEQLRTRHGAVSEERVIISDASASFDWALGQSFRAGIPRMVRTTDILMERVARLEEWQRAGLSNAVVIVPISEIVRETEVPTNQYFAPQRAKIQIPIPYVRTDLDTFSAQEIAALARHGYEVALKRVAGSPAVTGAFEGGQPSDPCVMRGGTWPMNAEYFPYIARLRAADSLGRLLPAIDQNLEEGFRTLDLATTGVSAPPPKADTRKEEAESEALKTQLERSRVLRLRLWSSGDWISWLTALLLLLLATVILWAFM